MIKLMIKQIDDRDFVDQAIHVEDGKETVVARFNEETGKADLEGLKPFVNEVVDIYIDGVFKWKCILDSVMYIEKGTREGYEDYEGFAISLGYIPPTEEE